MKNINIHIEPREILFDVMNKTHLAGDLFAKKSKNEEIASLIQASDDADIIYQLNRSITSAINTVYITLNEIIDEHYDKSVNLINQAVESGNTLVIPIKLTSNYDDSCIESISGLIHDYAVCRAVAEWYVITNKDDANIYVTFANDAITNLQKVMYKRVRPSGNFKIKKK